MWLLLGPALLCALVTAMPTEKHESLLVIRDEGVSDETTTESTVTTEGPSLPMKLTEMEVQSEVSMRYSHTAVVTRMRNPAHKPQEATFRVLLPDTAFISGFIMTLNGTSYKAYVKEKEEAKVIYNQAVSQGLGAAHVGAKARDSNHFTVSVNVEPNTEAIFNLTYEELLVRRNGVYNHAINLHPGVLVPKFTVTVHIIEEVKLTTLRVPEIRTGNEIDATEEDKQYSKAKIERSDNGYEATITFTPDLDEQKKLMDIYAEKSRESSKNSHRNWYEEDTEVIEGALGQFVVQYDVERSNDGDVLVNDGYFVHFFAPPSLPPLNKHVVFVLDTSGSMMDRKITQLREAMRFILDDLNEGDYFNIVEFSSSVTVHDLKEADVPPKKQNRYSYYKEQEKPTLVPPSIASKENVDKAKVIVSRLDADGGTNIGSALGTAIDLIIKGIKIDGTTEATKTDASTAKNDTERTLEPIIIFLTDGEPTVGDTNTQHIITTLSETNYGLHKAAVFSLAFGEDADRKFLRKLSLHNEGFMRHIYEAADAALQLRHFYKQIASPLLSNVKFIYPPEQVNEDTVTKHALHAYYLGSEAVVAGRMADGVAELAPQVEAFCGTNDIYKRIKFQVRPKVSILNKNKAYLPLERIWAYLTIKQLLDQKDIAELMDDENKNKERPYEKKALAIALKYEFVTPLTSLVVVKPNASDAVDALSVDKPQINLDRGLVLKSSAQSAPSFAFAVGPPGAPGAPAGGAALAGSAGFAYAPAVGYGLSRPSIVVQDVFDSDAFAIGELEDVEGLPDKYLRSSAASVSPLVPSSGIINYDIARPSSIFHAPSRVSPFVRPDMSSHHYSWTGIPSTTATPLLTYRLSDFPWTSRYLDQRTDSLQLNINGTTIVLKLSRDIASDPTKDGEPCDHAVDGKPGLCTYLPNCEAAHDISDKSYDTLYCSIDGYAGICCPKKEASTTEKKN